MFRGVVDLGAQPAPVEAAIDLVDTWLGSQILGLICHDKRGLSIVPLVDERVELFEALRDIEWPALVRIAEEHRDTT